MSIQNELSGSPNQYCAISIDVDPIGHYLNARGYEARPTTNINAIYDDAMPRFLDVFDEFGVKATFFIVGRDAKLKSNQAMLREAHERGHEIANHTYHHHQDFGVRPPDEKRDDIAEADKILSDTIGAKINGFRAPGWGVDRYVLEALEELGYTYDSSVFPSRLVSAINFTNWILNRGRLQRAMGKNWKIGTAPKLPYHPDAANPWKRGKLKLLEMPTTVLPVCQFPFIGTLLFLLGKSVFRSSYSWLRIFPRPLFYELHGIELVDYYTAVKDERLLVKPGLGLQVQQKVELYSFMLGRFAKTYKFATMNQIKQLYLS